LTLNRNLSGQPVLAKETIKPKRKAEPPSARESPKKKSRPSLPDVRPKIGGKSLPVQGARKSLPKPVVTETKFKSSEVIEESDIEDEDEAEGEEEEEGEDEFAAILAAEMASGNDDDNVAVPPIEPKSVEAGPLPGNVRVAAEYYDDSTESEESDDEF
jgi:hypothetical protein